MMGAYQAPPRSHLTGEHPSGLAKGQTYTLALKQQGCDIIPANEI